MKGASGTEILSITDIVHGEGHFNRVTETAPPKSSSLTRHSVSSFSRESAAATACDYDRLPDREVGKQQTDPPVTNMSVIDVPETVAIGFTRASAGGSDVAAVLEKRIRCPFLPGRP